MIDMIEPEVDTDESEQFTIDSDRAAEWLLRKLANLEAERARVTAQAAAIVKALDADAERLRFLFGSQLEAYCRARMEHNGNRRRSVAFLQGTCAFRMVPACVKVADPSAALAFAIESLPDAIRPTLDTGAYRDLAVKRLQESGEVLPGIEPTPERESFSVRFGKSE